MHFANLISKQYLLYQHHISFIETFPSIYHSVQIQIPAAQEITGATSSAQFHLSIILLQISNRCFKFLFHVRFHVSSKIRPPFFSSLKNEACALCYYITKNAQKCVHICEQICKTMNDPMKSYVQI